MLIVIFAVHLRWLPASGMGQPQHLVLPAFTLGMFLIGLIIRLMRSSMLDVLNRDYIRTAHAKGLSQHIVLVRHALKNACIPVVTVLGLQMGTLLGGAVITETVFAWPGMGMVTVTAIHQRDYPWCRALCRVSGPRGAHQLVCRPGVSLLRPTDSLSVRTRGAV
jgi:peptide/nickel transport system permease protein